MSGFEQLWGNVATVRGGEPVSAELAPLVCDAYTQLNASPIDLAGLKLSLQNLLQYLAGPGRTNANCWAVDVFFMELDFGEFYDNETRIPEDFGDILVKMGEALHDTVKSPRVAENFGCLPEQLLAAVNDLNTARE